MKIVKKQIKDLTPATYNPRKDLQPGDKEYEQLKRSVQEYGYVEPVIFNRQTGIVVGGHQRLKVLEDLGYTEVECVEVDIDSTKEKALNVALNKISGEWDDIKLRDLLQDLQGLEYDLELTGFTVEDLDGLGLDTTILDNNHHEWFSSGDKGEARDGEEEYAEFLGKFEAKHTTDDCYTPPKVYDAVVDWVEKEYGVDRAKFVRPFYPGGDYQKEKYAEDAIVVDNPPFSILAEILEFYTSKGIKFFLFCPALTQFSSIAVERVTSIVVGVGIIYENKANVSTSFYTNLEDPTIRVRTAPELYAVLSEKVKETVAELTKEIPEYVYPDYVVNSAILTKYAKYGVDFKIHTYESQRIGALDAQKEQGKGIFGSGLLLSEKAATEKAKAEKAAAERAAVVKAEAERTKAEKLGAVVWELSDREKEIVKSLGEKVG